MKLDRFESITHNNAVYLVRDGYQQVIPGKIEAGLCSGTAKGRGHHAIITLDDQTSAVIRQYKRGGLSRFLLPDIFWGDNRAVKEAVITAKAASSGVPAPEVLGIIIRPVFGPLCRLWIITKEIKAPTLENAITSLKNIHPPAALFTRKLNLIKTAAAAIKKLHQAGIRHRDLHIRNILIDADKAYIIDLDGATAWRTKSDEIESLIRLNRSIAKHLGITGISATDRLRLLRRYLEPNYFKANKKDIVSRCLRNIRLHQIWWSITGGK